MNKQEDSKFLFHRNKKAVQLTLETILLLVLTVSAVVVLSVFFFDTSGALFGKVKGYFIHSNVDAVVSGCNVLADTNSQYAFCCEEKNVKYTLDGKKTSKNFNCSELVNQGFINNRIHKLDCEGFVC